MTDADILEAVLERLTERTHTRGSLARNKDGEPCGHDDPAATRRCLLGHLFKASPALLELPLSHIKQRFFSHADILAINDTYSYGELRRYLAAQIVRLRTKERRRAKHTG